LLKVTFFNITNNTNVLNVKIYIRMLPLKKVPWR